MKQFTHNITFQTTGSSLLDVTGPIKSWIHGLNIRDGLLTIFIKHTSASLVIQENADPDVLYDLNQFFRKMVPEGPGLYRHSLEGPDDMPAHIKSALTQSQLSIPVTAHDLELGTWQGIYIFEHRSHAHKRTLSLHIMGE
ncbi:secondary thiamine-phosphate synthase enzyme YjbQ [Pseudemcibacter aquimaris]|uniref:secondary thiamine-phosphate synthase enzyme YjbQ n=1 Tax=Pseudemcibacter aquimaris TaxID=2857064 RepID=UPI0020127664|nr:secondary thiamine-phosphate synthase enzyme YjbQ [Pseudemcibacter aquimaris]MCC3862016.1 secondary thiamine-phosphate synthase enzyme YjbQ [Pseudemcibacter aquimaris]WDU58768.1 secondary thiamine-phosphate synthase enzyme YjbQ [Pseudemcibacter aquimaris]